MVISRAVVDFPRTGNRFPGCCSCVHYAGPRPAHRAVRRLGSSARPRARAGNKPIAPSSRRFAGSRSSRDTRFLDWLAQRQRVLRTCEQADIDTWHAEHNEYLRRCLRGFLLWSMAFPNPFAQLLLTWINERDDMKTATNPGSRWLFPGRCAGQPMHHASLAALVNRLGVPPTPPARRHPPTRSRCRHPSSPIPSATTRHRAQDRHPVWGRWSRYAPGDHTRTGEYS